jgi:hypothetical protein
MDSDAPRPEKPRKRRWLKRLLVAALVLLALGVLLYVLWDMHTRSALQAEITRIRAAGEPVTLEELWPPEIQPEGENAALLYEQASALFQEGGYEAFEGDVGMDISCDDPGSWSEEAAAAVRLTLTQCDEALALVRRAAHMERCRFDPRWGWPPTTPLYHYKVLRQATRALCWSAALKLHDGDGDGALEDARAAFLTSRALATDRTLISLLVQLAIIPAGLGEAQSVLERSDPPPNLLQAFLTDIEETRATLRTHLVDGYKSKRVVFLANLAQDLGLEDLLPAASRQAAPPLPPRGLRAWLGQPFSRGMVTGYLETVPRLLELGRADWVAAQPLIDSLGADTAQWRKHGARHYSQTLVAMDVPVWVGAKVAEARSEATLAVAEAVFALRLYKAEHREYPESLDALSPAFLQAVPTDPFTSKPLVYVRQEDGFLVYSMGLNGKDDGGLAETEEDDRAVNPGTDDIAWRCSR